MDLSGTRHRVGSRGAIVMRWHDLLFLHWPVEAASLQPFLPQGLLVDTREGQGWIGVVPFTMSGIRARYVPAIPRTSAFPELNVRTYVVAEPGLVIPGRNGVAERPGPGVWFFSLDAASHAAVRVARTVFHLAYYDASMSCRTTKEGWIEYTSTRTHRGVKPGRFEARYRPVGAPTRSAPGTLEHWLTERYWLYAADRRGCLYAGRVWHDPWPLQPAEAEVRVNTMAEASGISLPSVAPLEHFARLLEVDAALPKRLARLERSTQPMRSPVVAPTAVGMRAMPFWHRGRSGPACE